jgi:hypothetical protein
MPAETMAFSVRNYNVDMQRRFIVLREILPEQLDISKGPFSDKFARLYILFFALFCNNRA